VPQYWDTSAILKLFVAESDSAALQAELVDEPGPALTSSITPIEIYCAFLRKERDLHLPHGEAAALFRLFGNHCRAGRFRLIPSNNLVLEEAERLAAVAYGLPAPILIRSLDLIHIASARVAQADALIATDRRLRDLALALNVRVLPKGQP
jgi:predicted nucleic acid-binding protein